MNVARFLGLWLTSIACVWGATVDEKLPVLKVGGDVYTNVTVTSVTATDIYFTHAKGMGNAKLKNLDPQFQKHFGFDAGKAALAEQKQRAGNALFRAELLSKNVTAPRPSAEAPDDSDDFVVPQLHAKSFRGQRPPQIIVAEWLTPPPDVEGKFVLVDFWATWCGPCRQSIPHLNGLANKFKDKLVVIGLSQEAAADIQKMTSPRMEYCVGSDPEARSMQMIQVSGIPHAILIDPNGIVRFEGMPGLLTDEILGRLLTKYGN